jgi:hypothetical protein
MHTTHDSRHIGIEEWTVHNWKLKYYYCHFAIITVMMYIVRLCDIGLHCTQELANLLWEDYAIQICGFVQLSS